MALFGDSLMPVTSPATSQGVIQPQPGAFPKTEAALGNAFGSGGQQPARERGKRNTQTTRSYVEPTQEQQLLSRMGLENIIGFQPPAYQMAAPNATQEAAQQQALGAAIPQQNLANQGVDASQFLLRDVLFPGSNPALQATIAAANEAGNRNLQRNVLPAIRSDAVTTGNFDSSRRGIAEGIAASDAETNARNVAAQIATAGYGQGLGAMQTALGYLPQTSGLQLDPARTTAAVGDARQGQQQQQLDVERLNALLPYLYGQDLIGLSGALPGGTSVAETSTPKTPIKNLIGALATGASLLLP